MERAPRATPSVGVGAATLSQDHLPSQHRPLDYSSEIQAQTTSVNDSVINHGRNSDKSPGEHFPANAMQLEEPLVMLAAPATVQNNLLYKNNQQHNNLHHRDTTAADGDEGGDDDPTADENRIGHDDDPGSPTQVATELEPLDNAQDKLALPPTSTDAVKVNPDQPFLPDDEEVDDDDGLGSLLTATSSDVKPVSAVMDPGPAAITTTDDSSPLLRHDRDAFYENRDRSDVEDGLEEENDFYPHHHAEDDDDTPASVTRTRKHQLLLQARTDRLQWIERVPLPYREHQLPSFAEKKTKVVLDPWTAETRLRSIRSEHLSATCGLIPAALPILSHLYGISSSDGDVGRSLADETDTVSPADVATRIESIIRQALPFDRSDVNAAVPTKVITGSDKSAAILLTSAHRVTDSVLSGYLTFLRKLQDPSCATWVQSMRHFYRHVRELQDPDALASHFKSYLPSALAAAQQQSVFSKKATGPSEASSEQTEDEYLRRSLESFLFGQCYDHIESILWNESAVQQEQNWMDRVQSLQFVTPAHLDISCLADDSALTGLNLDELLQEPMKALQSVHAYFSPYEKLQRILALYRAVNSALSAALNRDSEPGVAPKKLPSADDVLPTIILTVLRAKPERLHLNLRIVEEFSPPEYLRGEAGYAYTNLYGAVHFLLDLDLEHPNSLSISQEDFKKGLEASRAAAAQRFNAASSDAPGGFDGALNRLDLAAISAQSVRAARLRGEIIGVDWALQLQQQRRLDTQSSRLEAENELPASPRHLLVDDGSDGLTVGFSRGYSFLAARPEDIKVTDLPQLLQEYRALVHTTERLMGERAAKAASERKSIMALREQELLARAQEIDPSLLPNGNKKPTESKS